MNNTLRIVETTDHANGTIVLSLAGRLDFQGRHPYQAAVENAQTAFPRRVIFEMSGVSYIDSAGLGLLTLTHRKYSQSGIQMAVAKANGTVKHILQLANMDKLFPISDSVGKLPPSSRTSSVSPPP